MLHNAMRMIAEEGRGVVVLISKSRPILSSPHPKLQNETDNYARPFLKDYGIGAQILVDLGVKNMILLSDTDNVLSGSGRLRPDRGRATADRWMRSMSPYRAVLVARLSCGTEHAVNW